VIVLILVEDGVEVIRVEVVVEVGLTLVQEGIWAQMGVNRMDQAVSLHLFGLEQNALVHLHICI
jgi:hypothetical protein